ncbi:MAG: mannose-1-phosphate guanylyltransferase [Bacteroidales bacterium]
MNSHFHCVIMAGGIGSRFWPMSRTSRPKQFIDVLGTGLTLIQQTYARFENFVPRENFWVVTGEAYRDLVLAQLPEVPPHQILTEPLRRNTAPCIAYAAARIGKRDPQAVMAVTPADHLVLKPAVFEATMLQALNHAARHDRLMTVGLTPTFPATGYGYIERGSPVALPDSEWPAAQKEPVCAVKAFKEKPDEATARSFLAKGGFYWNSGIFVWSVQTIRSALQTHLPQLSAAFGAGEAIWETEAESRFIAQTYAEARSISVDYGVMEKAHNVGVVCADFGWSDLGTWTSLYQLSERDENENALDAGSFVATRSSGNTIRITDRNKLLVIDGLHQFVVVDTPDVLFICPSGSEEHVRGVIQKATSEFTDFA